MSLEDDLNALEEGRRADAERRAGGWVPPAREPSAEEAFAEEFIAAAMKRSIASRPFLIVEPYARRWSGTVEHRLVGTVEGWGPLHDVLSGGDSVIDEDHEGVITVDGKIFELAVVGRIRELGWWSGLDAHVVILAHNGMLTRSLQMDSRLRQSAISYLDQQSR